MVRREMRVGGDADIRERAADVKSKKITATVAKAQTMRTVKGAKVAARKARLAVLNGAASPGVLLKELKEMDQGREMVVRKKGHSRACFAKQQLKEAREAVLERLPVIVKSLAEKSAESYLTAKFLFDFAEIEKISIATGNPGRPNSLKAVLRKLGFDDKARDRIEGKPLRNANRVIEVKGEGREDL